ncbi:hypothetical protein GH733_004138, partial [Mirounga leonina]
MEVEQSPSALSLQEGASSTLKCDFSSTVNNVQWFRQNPGGGSLTSLFYIVSGMKQSGRLNCTVNAKERSSTLHITASQLEDSATYLCAAQAQCSLVIQGEKVEQHPSTLSVQQGSSSVINCSYSDSLSEYFPWYKQEFGKGPQLLIDIRSTMATKEDQRLTVFLNKKAKHLSLHIKDTQPEDSAVKNEEHYLGDAPEMKCSPGFVTVVLLMLGQTHGDSVTQTEGQVTLSEKASLTVNCTYSASGYPALYWYVQYPGEGPRLLLKALRDKEKGSKKGFEANYDRDSKSFHLQKGSVQASDSAVYYCVMMNVQPKLFRDPWWVLLCLMTRLETHGVPEKVVMPSVFLTEYGRRASAPNQGLVEKEGKGRKEGEHSKQVSSFLTISISFIRKLGTNGVGVTPRRYHLCMFFSSHAGVRAMKVEQSPSALSLQEGASSTLKCKFSSTPDSVQWFQQNFGGGGLTRLFYIASGMKQSGRLNCTVNAKEQSSTLHLTDSQLEDSATYLCAVEAQCSLNEEHYLGDTPEMKCSPGFVTVVLLMFGQTHGDSVTQMEGPVTLSEEDSLTINCTYSTTGFPTLFWYVQYPGEGPELLLKALTDKEKGSKKGFESTYDRDSKSFHLQKGSVQASDSAVYYCVMMNVQPHKLFRDPWWVLLCLMTALETHSVPEKYERRGDGRASAPNQDLVEKEGKGRKEEEHLSTFLTICIAFIRKLGTNGAGVRGMEVEQRPSALSLQEGASSTL